MHEASLVAAMCAEIKNLAHREGAAKVNRIFIRLGELSGVEIEAFRLAFEAYQQNDPFFAEARLEIETVPARRFCFSCGHEFLSSPPCPRCGSFSTLPLSGEEMELSRVEFVM